MSSATSSYTADYQWDGAGNMTGKFVIDFNGRVHYNQMTWSAENRLLKQTGEVNFMNPSLVEGAGKEQNTWALARTALNGTFRSYTYDHLSRHVIQEGSSTSPNARYVVGPHRDDLLGAQLKTGKGLVKMYTYGNHRHDVLSVQAGNAVFTTNRRYLPTGVAISDPQTGSKGMPIGVPLAAQVPSNMPTAPMAYGWQGKEKGVLAWDFNNRNIQNSNFTARDPWVGELVPENEETRRHFMFMRSGIFNSLKDTDPDGLYSVSTVCNSVQKAWIVKGADRVYSKVLFECINPLYSAVLYGLLKTTKFSCSSEAEYMNCGFDSTKKYCACSYPGSNFVRVALTATGLNWCTPARMDNADEVSPFASMILHESVHLAGQSSECMPLNCQYRCRYKIGVTPLWQDLSRACGFRVPSTCK